MKLYHFTQRRYIQSILDKGIYPGEFPYQEVLTNKLVSLTSALQTEGHGLIAGQTINEGTKEFGVFYAKHPSLSRGQAPNRTMKLFDQLEAVIELDIPSRERKLWNFDKFSVKAAKKLKESKDRCKAAALAGADFPLANASDGQLNSRTLEIEQMLKKGRFKDRKWFFYDGVIDKKYISRVLYRQPNGGYSE